MITDPCRMQQENAAKVLEARYLRKGEDGRPIETPEEMFRRVARAVAKAESGDPQEVEEQFYRLLSGFDFLPNSPTFTGAETPLGQLAACFVLPIEDDLGREEGSIFAIMRSAALIQQTGGGNGFSFGRLRPRWDWVSRSAGKATGPIGFLSVYDRAFGEIAQGGSRRGANMAVMPVSHPDILDGYLCLTEGCGFADRSLEAIEHCPKCGKKLRRLPGFLTCKTEEGKISNFNLSVALSDEFMEAVKAEKEFSLVNPRTRGVVGRVEARKLFRRMCEAAHRNGEPGILFPDAANRDNPVPHLYQLEATNPCGEQWLGPYESCCLGSINLAQHTTNSSFDWGKLEQTVVLAVRFLDDVITANRYVPEVPQLKEAAERCRRIGLGIMGLGDVLYDLGIRYGSKGSRDFAGQVMEFIRFHAIRASIGLAKERGPFPAIKGSIYDPDNFRFPIPTPLDPYTHSFGCPALDWKGLVGELEEHGIRNAAQTTVAPTGTISTVAGCESSGCEPVFALSYKRVMVREGGETELTYLSPRFFRALKKLGLGEAVEKKVLEQVEEKGSCQEIKELPDGFRHIFTVARDVTPEEHVLLQAALQRFVDNSISKTCNLPKEATVEDVEKVFLLAHEKGLKGVTVYVEGSREKVVLKTIAEERRLIVPVSRPEILEGRTRKIDSPRGRTYITINRDEKGWIREVFFDNPDREMAGIARLLSNSLRCNIDPRELIEQLWKVEGREIVPVHSQTGQVVRVSSVCQAIALALLWELYGDDFLPSLLISAESLPHPYDQKGSKKPAVAVSNNSFFKICYCGHPMRLSGNRCLVCEACGAEECY